MVPSKADALPWFCSAPTGICHAQASLLRQRRFSEAVSLARLSELCSLYIPLAPQQRIPGVRQGLCSLLHFQTILLAAACHSVTRLVW